MMYQAQAQADFSTIFEVVSDIKIDSDSVYQTAATIGLDLAIEQFAKVELFNALKVNRKALNLDPERVSTLVKRIYGYMEEDYTYAVLASFEQEYK